MKENVIGFIGVIVVDDSEKYSSADLLRYTISVISRWACLFINQPQANSENAPFFGSFDL